MTGSTPDVRHRVHLFSQVEPAAADCDQVQRHPTQRQQMQAGGRGQRCGLRPARRRCVPSQAARGRATDHDCRGTHSVSAGAQASNRRPCILRTPKGWPNISGFSPSPGGADHYSGASQRCVKPSGRPSTPAGNLSPKPSAPNREEGRSYQPNKEKMTLIRLRAPQLGQMTLNEVGIERCAERPIELTKSLARAAPCTTLGACRSSHAMFICGGHVWIAPHLHGQLSNQPPNIVVDRS
jgi:hypothetical protein